MLQKLLSFIPVVRAANADCNSGVGSGFNPECPPNIGDILSGSLADTVQQVLFGLGPALFIVAIIYAGYTRLTAADNPQKVKQANFTIMWGAIGYAVVLLSFFIIRFVATLLGADNLFNNGSVGVTL